MPGHSTANRKFTFADYIRGAEQGAHAYRLAQEISRRCQRYVLIKVKGFYIEGPANPFRGNAAIERCKAREENAVADQVQNFHSEHHLSLCVGARKYAANLLHQVIYPRRHPGGIATTDVRRVSQYPHGKLERVFRKVSNLKYQTEPCGRRHHQSQDRYLIAMRGPGGCRSGAHAGDVCDACSIP